MHCYLCLITGGGEHRSACAICQRCGAAICEQHLVPQLGTPPPGMGGGGNPRYLLVCQRCAPANEALLPSSARSVPSSPPKLLPRWRRQLLPGKQPALPSPQEAVAEAEHFLKKQRRQRWKWKREA